MFGSATSGSEAAAGDIRCIRCDVYGHTRAHCRAVVQLRSAPNPPLHLFFDVGLLPPWYHFTDYSLVLTSTTLASLPQQQWVIEQQPQQQEQKQEQQQQWALDEQKRLLDTQKPQLEQQRQWLDQQRLQQWLEQQRRQQYEQQQQQQEPQQKFCSGVIPRAGEHGILIIKREGENVPEGTEREDSLVAADTRAGQMMQLPGAREEMIPPSQLTTPMGEISPGEYKEQEDMLGRPEGQPKMRKKECAPEGVHDQQEDLLNREQTTRECVPEGMRDKQEDLFHRNMNAHQGDKVDDDTRTPTEARRYRKPRTARRAPRGKTRKERGKGREANVVGRGSACKLRRTTRPKRARARER